LNKASDINPDEKIWETYRKVKSLMRGPATLDEDYEATGYLEREQEKSTAYKKEAQNDLVTSDLDYFCNM
jgi:hypothetical protein